MKYKFRPDCCSCKVLKARIWGKHNLTKNKITQFIYLHNPPPSAYQWDNLTISLYLILLGTMWIFELIFLHLLWVCLVFYWILWIYGVLKKYASSQTWLIPGNNIGPCSYTNCKRWLYFQLFVGLVLWDVSTFCKNSKLTMYNEAYLDSRMFRDTYMEHVLQTCSSNSTLYLAIKDKTCKIMNGKECLNGF